MSWAYPTLQLAGMADRLARAAIPSWRYTTERRLGRAGTATLWSIQDFQLHHRRLASMPAFPQKGGGRGECAYSRSFHDDGPS
jgi:hypothetical protein